MKIERNYFFHTVMCKTKTYNEILNELDEKFVSKVVENIYKYCDFNFSDFLCGSNDRPRNLEEFKKVYEKLIDYFSNTYRMSSKYGTPSTKIESSYVYCPKCKAWHMDYKFLQPITSWDYIFQKYGELITFDILYRIFSDASYRNVSKFDKYGEIFALLYDEKLAKELYEKEAEQSKSYVFEPIPPFGGYYNIEYYNNLYIPYNEFVRGNNGMPILKCPSCGLEIELEQRYDFSHIKPINYSFTYLTRSNSWWQENQFPASYEIYSNEDDPKIVLSIMYNHYFPNVYGKMRVKKTNDRIVFNTETGLSYELRPVDFETKEPIFEETRIKNITYNHFFNRFSVPPEALQDTVDAICKKQNIDTISVESLKTTKADILSILTTVNRYAKLGKDFLFNYLAVDASSKLGKKEKREFFEMQNEENVFLKALQKQKISSKYLKKMFATNPMFIYFYNTLKKIGFKNIDVIASLIKSEQMVSIFKNVYKHQYVEDMLRKFVEDYSSLKTEAELAKKIIATKDTQLLRDIGTIYHRCTPILEVLTVDQKKKIFKGSIKSIHDLLLRLSISISEIDYYIPYTLKELKHNCICGNYVFTLAKTTAELSSVGETMHICVGSYSNRALYKECVIVLMRDKRTKELAVCIELSPDYKKMKQAKDFCNREVSPEKLSALVSYFEKYHIEYASAYDGERNNLDKVEKRENAIQLNDTDGYMIFESKEQFIKVLIDKIITVDNEVIQLPEDFFEDDEIQENLFMDMPFI